MTINETGLIRWKPRKLTDGEGEIVLVLIKDSSGEDTYHKFVLPVLAK